MSAWPESQYIIDELEERLYYMCPRSQLNGYSGTKFTFTNKEDKKIKYIFILNDNDDVYKDDNGVIVRKRIVYYWPGSYDIDVEFVDINGDVFTAKTSITNYDFGTVRKISYSTNIIDVETILEDKVFQKPSNMRFLTFIAYGAGGKGGDGGRSTWQYGTTTHPGGGGGGAGGCAGAKEKADYYSNDEEDINITIGKGGGSPLNESSTGSPTIVGDIVTAAGGLGGYTGGNGMGYGSPVFGTGGASPSQYGNNGKGGDGGAIDSSNNYFGGFNGNAGETKDTGGSYGQAGSAGTSDPNKRFCAGGGAGGAQGYNEFRENEYEGNGGKGGDYGSSGHSGYKGSRASGGGGGGGAGSSTTSQYTLVGGVGGIGGDGIVKIFRQIVL